MVHKIRAHVENLFEGTPDTARAYELKEELISNLTERYNDLVEEGKSEEAAYSIVVTGIGDIGPVISSLREDTAYSTGEMSEYRRLSAIRVSIAVGAYIMSIFIPLITDRVFGDDFVGLMIMFMVWAGATGLLVYNSIMKPKDMYSRETVVEDFKRYTKAHDQQKAIKRSLHSIIWASATIVYILVSFSTHAWHLTWLIFLLAVVAGQILNLIITMNDDRMR
jgi:hypothetical protein